MRNLSMKITQVENSANAYVLTDCNCAVIL